MIKKLKVLEVNQDFSNKIKNNSMDQTGSFANENRYRPLSINQDHHKESLVDYDEISNAN